MIKMQATALYQKTLGTNLSMDGMTHTNMSRDQSPPANHRATEPQILFENLTSFQT